MSQQDQKGKPGPRIYAQLAAIMAAADAVGKERRNSGQGFSYRGIEDIMDALHPIFAENKVYILSEVIEEKTEERATMKGGTLIYRVLKAKVWFVSGEDGSRESVVVVGEGMDSGDKAANKAMSAALKYALTQTLILPYGQTDGDADTPESKPKTAFEKAQAEGRVTTVPPAQEKPEPNPKAKAPPEATAFHSRLYDALTLHGITDEELKRLLVAKGAMTAAMSIHNLPDKTVDLILDGKDRKTGRDNWDLIVEQIKKGRGK
jgi:hypothetical protein